MYRTVTRNIYLKNLDGKIHKYQLSYTRIGQDEFIAARKKGEFFSEIPLWLMERIVLPVDLPSLVPVLNTLIDRIYMAEYLTYGGRGKRQNDPGAKYVTVLLLLDEDYVVVAGGSSVCGPRDVPDRKFGYSQAFERMKNDLQERGYEIIPRRVAAPISGELNVAD